MLVIDATNVNDAWHQAKIFLNAHGVARPSRVGAVLEYPDPVTTKYLRPTERVLFDVKRDANPFFHFFEGLWMLAGRNDVAWISRFNKRMMSFSDDGVTYHAAYGYRWRHHFGETFLHDGDISRDQLPKIIKLLRDDHTERRAVLQMWDPKADLGRTGKDLPCNTAVYFKVRENRLFMTVTNRSNDIVWGCYGANCVHMSMLQEYIAAMVGVEVGPYHQVSDSWHAYTEYWEQYGGTDSTYLPRDLYEEVQVRPFPLVHDSGTFDDELRYFVAEPDMVTDYNNLCLSEVAVPMFAAWSHYKAKRYTAAMETAEEMSASDWRVACTAWLNRRMAARKIDQMELVRKVA